MTKNPYQAVFDTLEKLGIGTDAAYRKGLAQSLKNKGIETPEQIQNFDQYIQNQISNAQRLGIAPDPNSSIFPGALSYQNLGDEIFRRSNPPVIISRLDDGKSINYGNITSGNRESIIRNLGSEFHQYNSMADNVIEGFRFDDEQKNNIQRYLDFLPESSREMFNMGRLDRRLYNATRDYRPYQGYEYVSPFDRALDDDIAKLQSNAVMTPVEIESVFKSLDGNAAFEDYVTQTENLTSIPPHPTPPLTAADEAEWRQMREEEEEYYREQRAEAEKAQEDNRSIEARNEEEDRKLDKANATPPSSPPANPGQRSRKYYKFPGTKKRPSSTSDSPEHHSEAPMSDENPVTSVNSWESAADEWKRRYEQGLQNYKTAEFNDLANSGRIEDVIDMKSPLFKKPEDPHNIVATDVDKDVLTAILRAKTEDQTGNVGYTGAIENMIDEWHSRVTEQHAAVDVNRKMTHMEKEAEHKRINEQFMEQLTADNVGPNWYNYMMGNKLHVGAMGTAVIAGTMGVAFGGHKSNAELYSSPF